MKPLADRLVEFDATNRYHFLVCNRRDGDGPASLRRPVSAAPDTPKPAASVLALAGGDPVIGFLWAAIGLTLWHDHNEARTGAEKESANLARSFDESIARTVEAVDQTLLFIREAHQNDRAAYAPQAWAQSRSFLNDLHLADFNN